jgi:hypothetical protein
MLKASKPFVVVEQKPNNSQAEYGHGVKDAVKLLRSLGASTLSVMDGDYLMCWEDR